MISRPLHRSQRTFTIGAQPRHPPRGCAPARRLHHLPTMEALHQSGSTIKVSRAYDLRTLRLLQECGYTHVRMPTWAWEPITTAIASATP